MWGFHIWSSGLSLHGVQRGSKQLFADIDTWLHETMQNIRICELLFLLFQQRVGLLPSEQSDGPAGDAHGSIKAWPVVKLAQVHLPARQGL